MKRNNKAYRKALSLLLVFLIFLSSANITVFAEGTEAQVQRVTNSFVQYSVSENNGRFSIKTDEGVPNKEDENSRLLYEEEKPETSFTTFRIDDEDYIYGNNYGFLNLDGAFSAEPQIQGKRNISTWIIGGVHITQRLELLEDADNPNVGNVRITYEVLNKDSSSKSIGARMLLDTMLGSNDGAPISLAGSQVSITREEKITGKDIPQYWRSTDNLFMPTVISYGFTQGWGNLKPDQMVIGHWNGLSQSKWDYLTDNTLDFTKTDNKYGSADSAVALYWNPTTVKPGERKVFETYYGIGNFQNINDGAKFNLNLNAPEKLVLNENKTGYTEDTFEIVAEIDNTMEDASNLTNVTASLILDEGLELLDGQVPYISTDVIKRNELYTFKWEVKAENSSSYTSKQFRVDISSDNSTEPVSKGKYIIIPGVSGKPPEIQFMNVTPGKLYYQGVKTFTIKGSGYDVYMNKDRWKLLLVNDLTKKTALQIPRNNINVKDDSITASFDENLEKGSYTIRIEHEDLGNQTIKYKLNMTDEKRYQSKAYGVLYVKKSKIDEEWQYTIETTDSEESLSKIKEELSDEEEIILNIKGDVRESEEEGSRIYRVYTDTEKAVINSVLHYSGQPLVLQKVDDTAAVEGIDTIAIAGDGKLTLENDFSFWWWDFEINIADGENYVTEFADDEEANIELEFTGIGRVLKWVAGFAIELNNAVLLDKGVSFGGSIELPLPFGDDEDDKKPDSKEPEEEEVSGADLRRLFGEEEYERDNDSSKKDDDGEEEEDESGIKAEISKVLFGMEDDEFGFVGIDSVTELKMPKNSIPISWIQDGFEATLTINTIDDVYGLEAEVNIKIVEAYVNLTFMKNQGTGNYLPDDVVLAGGYEPGVPLGPTGIFVTKIGGGVEDLYGTLTGDNSLPPLQVILMTSIDFAKVITLDAKLSINKEGFLLEGEGEIARIKALEEVKVGIRWARPVSLELAAKLSLFEIIEGEISLYIGEDRWEGVVAATVSVPDDIWLVGGQELLGAEFGANNKKIWGSVKIIRIPVGITYFWGKGVDFDVASAGDNMLMIPDKGIYSTTLREEDGDDMLMVVGSNIRRLGSSNTYYAALGSGYQGGLVAAAAGNQEHYMTINNQDIALLEFEYSGERPDIHVYRPDSTEYPLISIEKDITNANMLYQEIQPESSSIGETKKFIYISLVNPENGEWKIVSDKPIVSSLLDVQPAPEFNSIGVTETSVNSYSVEWDAEYSQDTMVDIYLANDKNEAGMQLANDIDGSSGQYNVTVPAGVEEGDYYIRATIEKGDFGYDSIYAADPVHVIDPHKPEKVTELEAKPYGDGLLRVDWRGVNEEGVDGYIITVYDKDGNAVESIGHQFAGADKSSIILGGRYKIRSTSEMGGLKPGEEYSVGIVTSKRLGSEENYTCHYSDTAYSEAVYLPEPDPAGISIQFDESFIDGYNNDGVPTKLSNKDKVALHFISDQNDITAEVLINGVLYKRTAGNEFEVSIPTADGNYSVQFTAVNDRGDTSTKTVQYTIDKTAPLLMIDSPKQGQLSESGEIIVEGITEKDAAVTVNGLSTPVDSEGRFERTVALGDSFKKNIAIEVRDKADNVTRYETEVVNDTVKTIDRLYIKPVINEMQAGEALAFEAAAIDDKGREIAIKDGVEWSLLMGESLAEVSEDGVLQTFSNGDLVLKAAYYVSEDYTFEDVMSIKVLPKAEIIDESSGNTDEGSDNNNGGGSKEDEADKKSSSSNDKDTNTVRELERILASIISKEENVRIINTTDIFSNQPRSILLDNNVRLDIPGNAIEQRDKLLVGIVEDNLGYTEGNSGGRKLLSPIYELQFARSNNSFIEPVRLIFEYDESEIGDIGQVAVYYYNEAFDKWQYLGGVADRSAKTISVGINHFSKYALIEDGTMLQFKDMTGRWSENPVKGLYSLGVVNGIKDGNSYKYEPSRNITRLEFTKLVIETLHSTGRIDMNGNTALPFEDKWEIPEWGKKYAGAAFANNIVKGRGTGTGYVFDSNALITRAEAAAIIGRTLEELGNTQCSFADQNQLPSWAKDYIGALWNKRIIKGNPDNTFRPNGNLTREEAASLIFNWICQ